MTRLMVIMSSASYRARAFLKAAQELEIPVVVGTDHEPVFAAMNPAGLVTMDLARPDEAARAAAEYHATRGLAGVIAAEDDGVLAAAAIAERLGLAGSPPAAVERARDKRRLRECLAAAGLPSPWFEVWPADDDPRRIAERLRFPCVLKPPALSASRGVLRADSPAEFITAFARVRAVLADAGCQGRDAEVLVEEYLPGVEVALEGLLTGGRLRTIAVFDKPDPLEGPTFEESIYVTPSRRTPADLQRIEATVAAMTAALGLTHGPVHAEVRLDGRGCWPVEIAPRSIGGLCSRTLRSREGKSLEHLLLRHALGQDDGGWRREPDARGVMMIPIPKRGILQAVHGIQQARKVPGIEDVVITIALGHPVTPLPEGSRYLGFLFASAPEPAAAEIALRLGHERLRFDIEDSPSRG